MRSLARFMLIAAFCALGLAACGRRGPLEPPGTAQNAPRGGVPAARVAGGPAIEGQSNPPGQAQVDDSDQATDNLVGSPIPAAPKGVSRRRAFTVPTTPFALDPLL